MNNHERAAFNQWYDDRFGSTVNECLSSRVAFQAGAAYQREQVNGEIEALKAQANGLVGAIEEITSITFDEIACRTALEALAAYRAAQGEKP